MSSSGKSTQKIITVFGSSRPREGDPHYAIARELGAALAKSDFVVCSGGYGGVMAAASRGAKEAGGRTLAVTAEFFRSRANQWVDEEVRVKSWQERLFELIRRGSGYVACPGGTGTLVELAVVWEMLNKGVMRSKPFVALGEFWQPIIERVREVELGHESSWGEADGRIVHVVPRPADAAQYLAETLSRNIKATA
ncbi:MAG TPA: LOG family protein [Candidatus Acidoferrales bacterium]|nr:LOG family protein [Candidatus Acidoferrales bacterium]